MLKSYYLLLKPGILIGNLITMSAAFVLGAQGVFNPYLLAASLIGLLCVIGSACVFNNCIDRRADAKMERTKNRPLVLGTISLQGAFLFGVFLAVFGFWTLAYYTNWIAFFSALLGWLIYVVFYSFGKYKSALAVWVGAVAGATPPLVGYCAASDCLDGGALLLFLLLLFWQMAHFFSIAIFRLEEYKAADIPVFPLTKGMQATKVHMLIYIGVFLACLWSLYYLKYAGLSFALVMAVLGLGWFALCVQGLLRPQEDRLWARSMFRCSLIVIMSLSAMLLLTV